MFFSDYLSNNCNVKIVKPVQFKKANKDRICIESQWQGVASLHVLISLCWNDYCGRLFCPFLLHFKYTKIVAFLHLSLFCLPNPFFSD